MAKNKWKRDGDDVENARKTGLPRSVLERLDESLLDEKGNLRTDVLSDCNVFTRRDIARAAGYKNPSRFWQEAPGDPRFHHRKLTDAEGHVVSQPTHTDSAAWFGKTRRAEKAAAMPANIRRAAERPIPLVRKGGIADPEEGEG